MRTVIFRAIAPYLTSLMVLFSIFVLLRGHNEPGGGFIGGLIAASALAIYGIACGVEPVRRAIYFHPMGISAFGLFVGTLAGVLSVFAGVSFMTGLWVYPTLVRCRAGAFQRAGLRHRRLSRRGRGNRRRSLWRLKKGTGTDGTSLCTSGRCAVHGGDLSVHVQAHHPRVDGRSDPEQRRQPADLHRRAGSPARSRRLSARIPTCCRQPAANPLPQALVLTAIVIAFSFFAFLLVLGYRAFQKLGTDDSDEMRVAEPVNEPAPPLGY
jgi:multicomponent Na+:H+ antiporter subunit B